MVLTILTALPSAEPPEPRAFRLSLRYEGLLAAKHEMDLGQLGESLQGFAKTIAVSANLVITGTPAFHFDALRVQVVAQPVDEHHCFEVWALVKPIVQSKEFWAGALGAGATIFAPVIAYVLSSRNTEEMKHLSDALKQSMTGNQAVTEKLVATIEKMADALNPSVRKALAPIDRSCARIDLYSEGEKVHTMDAATKEAFASRGSRIADHSKTFAGVITEFDMTNGNCKVQLEGTTERISARVLDPVHSEANNPYVTAMASQALLKFLAKFETSADGHITKLHIFDTAED